MRITENLKFQMLMSTLSLAQKNYGSLAEKMASQKDINRPSDDPIGATRVLNYRSVRESIDQYQRNIENANAWMEITHTKLESVLELIAEAKEAGLNDQSSDTRQVLAQTVGSLIEELQSLANSKFGDRYLFSGTATDTEPFSRTILPVSASANAFDGSLYTGGTYTGTSDKTFTVRVVNGGALGAATYQVSEDGGATWLPDPAGTVPADGTITLGDGLTLTFVDDGSSPLVTGDIFTVNAYESGTATASRVDDPQATAGNTFAGTVALDASSGTYAGETNRTFVVKFVNGGGAVGDADYQISADGGKTWSATYDAAWGTTITVDSTPGNEIILQFTPSGPGDNLAENDIFHVQARASWNYNGNGENLSVRIGKGNTATYNVSGEEAFTGRGKGEVDLFGALETLKTALESGDRDLVNEQVTRLTAAQDHIREKIASVGARMSGLNISKENYQVLDEKMSGLISDTEEVDLASLIVEFQMKETALQASYAMAVEIGKKSILDFLT
ncbi:MAG TPA: hypothetical protein PLR20_10430 [Syntrophales bacterium]|nr:hypothetical protein [Syntrophales bacterium]HOX93409.1 hypothetical protein [Syntrophales bacterium]HPI56628.1 hypothetical protein [Syntrophales bacterium]HPN24946.1 hypothetical protein [Syntrophales bacterium]HQM29755.1 hypothetical protein [Syntrophales bacterium]